MNPIISPLIQPQINWAEFAANVKRATGRDPTRSADTDGTCKTEYDRFLRSLGSFHGRSIKSLRAAGSLADHLTFGFLVAADGPTLLALVERASDLKITTTELPTGDVLTVVTGSLATWYAASLECCIEAAPLNLRRLMNLIVSHFEKVGLGPLWASQRKRVLPDKTLALEHKK